MLETQINVRTESFDGPLALLLHLIQKHEMNIREFNLSLITKQYLHYIEVMQNLNFDLAGDYLYMASALLYLKSQAAIAEEDGRGQDQKLDDFVITREDLISRLESLAHYQKLGKKLWDLPKRGEDIFVRPKIDRKAIANSILSPVELPKLTEAMIDLLKKQARKFQIVKRDRLSIREKLVELKGKLKFGEATKFSELLAEDLLRDNIVITFISLLELGRLKKLRLFQNESFGEIYVEVVEDLKYFDVDLANGFEPEDPSPSVELAQGQNESNLENVLVFPQTLAEGQLEQENN